MNLQDQSVGIPSHVERHFSAQRQSGLSIRAYCEARAVSVSTFYYWRKRYRWSSESKSASEKRTAFLDAGLFELNSGSCEVRFPNGMSVFLQPGLPGEQLRSLLGAIAELDQC